MTDVFHVLYMFSLSLSYVNPSAIFVWLHGRQNIIFFCLLRRAKYDFKSHL